MAVTVIETNNKLIRFTQEINREFVRQNMFSPYMSEGLNAIIRLRSELKAGGEDMNIPLVTRLTGSGVATTTLVGNEEKIDNFGMRVRLEWARNAVVTTKAESQKDSADIFGEAKPLLSDWGKELQRDEIIAAFMAIPSETLPTSSGGIRVNGIQFDLASTTDKNNWRTYNLDRILFGNSTANSATDFATSLGNVDTTNDKFTATNLSLLKRVAQAASPRIRPYMTDDGYEHFVCFAGLNTFRDLKISLETINKDARPREAPGLKNPIFQDGDQIYDGVIVRCVPEISMFVGTTANPGPWGPAGTGNLLAGGASSARVEPVFLCGQQAMAFCWGQMAKPTFRKEDDYGFITGTGIEMAYGVAKMFKRHPFTSTAGTNLKQWGVATGFFASASD